MAGAWQGQAACPGSPSFWKLAHLVLFRIQDCPTLPGPCIEEILQLLGRKTELEVSRVSSYLSISSAQGPEHSVYSVLMPGMKQAIVYQHSKMQHFSHAHISKIGMHLNIGLFV